jgi:phospholipid-binding lipoprotein MlaA
MRDRLQRRGVPIAILAIALAFQPSPSTAGGDPVNEHPPGTNLDLDVSAGPSAEPDPLFDDDFEIESPEQVADPFERGNRKIFVFNEFLDTVMMGPVLTGYRFLVPNMARKGIRRMFLNLSSPKIFVNDLFQLRFRDAGITLGRLVLNTTLGFGGLLDPGEAAGWPRHDSDFGQTMARYGMPSGPYLVVPVLGPSTVRDGFGDIVDLAFQPLTYVLWPAQIMLQVYIGGGKGLAALDANYDKVNALEESSIDFYAAMRSAYLQNRRAVIAEVRREIVESEDLAVPDEEAEKEVVDSATAQPQ